MAAPPILPDEQERLKALHAYDILDSDQEKEFDDIVRLASQTCDCPFSLIELVDSDRAWFKAKTGIGESQVERKAAFCSYTIENNVLFQIADATKDARFSNNSLVTGKENIKFYAGVPLINNKGYTLGALSVLDTKPKELSAAQAFALETLASLAMKLVESRTQNNTLQNIKQVQEKLLSIVSHDVRNPLASLRSIINLWTENLLSREEADEMLRVSAAQVDGAIDMISNLTRWAKLSSKINIETTHVNLDALVKKAYSIISGANPSKENSFTTSISENLVIECNENLLQFIIQNLLSNAVKFTDHGIISVDAQLTGNKLVIVIKDSGTGMSAEMVDQLFNGKKNYPLPGTANETGNGLGLMLINDLLNKYKGNINVVSAPNEGTTVFITVKL